MNFRVTRRGVRHLVWGRGDASAEFRTGATVQAGDRRARLRDGQKALALVGHGLRWGQGLFAIGSQQTPDTSTSRPSVQGARFWFFTGSGALAGTGCTWTSVAQASLVASSCPAPRQQVTTGRRPARHVRGPVALPPAGVVLLHLLLELIRPHLPALVVPGGGFDSRRLHPEKPNNLNGLLGFSLSSFSSCDLSVPLWRL